MNYGDRSSSECRKGNRNKESLAKVSSSEQNHMQLIHIFNFFFGFPIIFQNNCDTSALLSLRIQPPLGALPVHSLSLFKIPSAKLTNFSCLFTHHKESYLPGKLSPISFLCNI